MNPNSFEIFANRLLLNPEIHAKFVNTLSMLEYIGARKILKSQPEKEITAQILAHAAEEIRHAQGFKRIALKMSGGKLSSYSDEHLYCGPEARRYFQSLDHGTSELLGSRGAPNADNLWKNYLITTLLIEERANSAYPIYETILSRAGFPGVLSGIVREEVIHLEEMQNHLKGQNISAKNLDQLRQLEESTFRLFLDSLLGGLPAEDVNSPA